MEILRFLKRNKLVSKLWNDIYSGSDRDSRRILGVRVSALIEVFIFTTVILAFSHLLGDGSHFINYYPHPFWIILLLIIVQYGTNEALVTVVIITGSLYMFNAPDHIITESLYDHWLNLTQRPLMWTTAAVILGGLRSRRINAEFELREDLREQEVQNDAITESYGKLQTINEALERRMAGEVDSAIKIYEAAQTLESLERTKRIEGINDIISSIMNPDKFSIYILEQNGLQQLSTTGWTGDEGYLTCYNAESPLFKSVVGMSNILSLINEEDEFILDGEGVIAGPLIDKESGEVQGMIKFEEFGFTQMTLRNLHMFRILCEWIGMSIRTMNKIEESDADSLMDRNHMLYSYNFLKCQTDFLVSLAVRMNFHLTKLNIKLTNSAQLSNDERTVTVLAMGDAIRSALRQVDQIFDGENKGEEFAVLLPGTGDDNTNIVITKIKTALKKNNVEIKKAKFSYTIQTLNHVKE